MALVHDLHEAIGDDIPSRTYKKDWVITPEEKRKVEDNETAKILSLLSEKDQKPLFKLWNELRSAKTREAQLVRGIDKIDFIIQSVVYSNRTKQKRRFREFFVDAKRSLKDKDLIYIMQKARRIVLQGK